MASNESDDDYHKIISTELESYHPFKHQRYAAVNVLLISWEDDDTGNATEIKQLQTLFQDSFNYTVESYLIPSTRPQQLLQFKISQCILTFGKPDNLLVIYYGGHGGQQIGISENSCTWAAINTGGPSLDWSTIQPSLLNAGCDVAIILDCCYAGQAAKSTSAHAIELLAATDKDQWVPGSTSKRQTFTGALIEQMKKMLKRDETVTLGGLAKYLSATEAGILRQPFHTSLGDDHTIGPIKLAPLCDSKDRRAQIAKASPTAPVQLTLSLFQPLNPQSASSLIRWLTKDSPTSIENI